MANCVVSSQVLSPEDLHNIQPTV